MLPEIVPNVSIQNTTVSSIKQLTSRIVQIKFDRSRSFRASSSTNTSMDIPNIGRRSTSSISTRLHNLNLSSKIPQARYTIQTEATSENQGESSEENTVQVDLPVSRIYSTTTNNPQPTVRVFYFWIPDQQGESRKRILYRTQSTKETVVLWQLQRRTKEGNPRNFLQFPRKKKQHIHFFDWSKIYALRNEIEYLFSLSLCVSKKMANIRRGNSRIKVQYFLIQIHRN